IDNNMMAAVPGETKINAEYLFYFLCTKDLGRLCQEGAVPSVNQTHLSEIPIDLPPLDEQNSIVKVLRIWDEAIQKMDHLIIAKEQRIRGMLVAGVGDARTVGKHSDWIRTTIGDVTRVMSRRVTWDEQATYRLITVKRACGGLVFRGDRKGY